MLDGDNAGFPNGRRLSDDVLDIALQVVEGELLGTKNDLGDAVNENDQKFEQLLPVCGAADLRLAGPARQGGRGQGRPGQPAHRWRVGGLQQ